MSLPREWCLQDSRGSLHRSSGPTNSFTADTATPSKHQQFSTNQFKIQQLQQQQTQQQTKKDTTFLPIADMSAIENHFQHSQSNRNSLLSDTHSTAGSLFSIHSAPPAGIAELGGSHALGGRGVENGTESPRRPVSLAIDTFKFQHTLPHQTSEIEEEDNENLLTVSSLTARPLIAKSRELRSSRLEERRKCRIRSAAEPPDGGYGWFVVFGAFSVQFWVAGLVKSYGVLYVEIMETFPSSSAALASWIPAILSALCLALAPLSSALCQRFSCRSVVFIGGIFCALGLTLSYFATSMIHLLFTFGILTGIGGGLSTTPGIVIVSQYFDKHRALANGICVSGTAAGSFVFPMLIEHLVNVFGFHGTILILGGCMLHVCVSATIYRPVISKEEQAAMNAAATTTISSLSSNLLNNNNSSSNRNATGSIGNINTNSTYISSSEEPLNNNKKYIEHLFLEECKNRINDFYNTNKFVNVTDKILQLDSDDEIKDVVGETTFMKQMGSVRSSSLLHSVEDLSTDSTFVYKNRTGFDSNRGSRRRNKNAFSTDEILAKIPSSANNNNMEIIPSSIPTTQNRGLSKSMIIPTPVSDFNEFDDDNDRKVRSTCCDKVTRYLDVTLLRDPVFILMCLSVTLMATGCPYMLFYLPAYVTSAGYLKSEAGYLVAVSAAFDLCGRLGLGWLSDLQIFDRKKAYIICVADTFPVGCDDHIDDDKLICCAVVSTDEEMIGIFGAGVAVLIIPFANTWYVLGFAAGMYGLCLGGWYLLVPVLLADIFGTDRISSSYGLVRLFQSIGAISVPPLAGFARDVTGGYEVVFYSMGTCMVIGTLPLIFSTLIYNNISKNTLDSLNNSNNNTNNNLDDDDNDNGTIS